jgi:hypothetical protein
MIVDRRERARTGALVRQTEVQARPPRAATDLLRRGVKLPSPRVPTLTAFARCSMRRHAGVLPGSRHAALLGRAELRLAAARPFQHRVAQGRYFGQHGLHLGQQLLLRAQQHPRQRLLRRGGGRRLSHRGRHLSQQDRPLLLLGRRPWHQMQPFGRQRAPARSQGQSAEARQLVALEWRVPDWWAVQQPYGLRTAPRLMELKSTTHTRLKVG